MTLKEECDSSGGRMAVKEGESYAKVRGTEATINEAGDLHGKVSVNSGWVSVGNADLCHSSWQRSKREKVGERAGRTGEGRSACDLSV